MLLPSKTRLTAKNSNDRSYLKKRSLVTTAKVKAPLTKMVIGVQEVAIKAAPNTGEVNVEGADRERVVDSKALQERQVLPMPSRYVGLNDVNLRLTTI
jgi:hypothetical protein